MPSSQSAHTSLCWEADGVDEMLARGRDLASLLSPGAIVLLIGEMGAGKTTLAKGIVEGFGAGGADDVSSPTFTLMHEYRSRSRVLHLDLYRLESSAAARAIGVEEWIDETRDADTSEPTILLVEWGERFPDLWPANHVRIQINAGASGRQIELQQLLKPSPETPDRSDY